MIHDGFTLALLEACPAERTDFSYFGVSHEVMTATRRQVAEGTSGMGTATSACQQSVNPQKSQKKCLPATAMESDFMRREPTLQVTKSNYS